MFISSKGQLFTEFQPDLKQKFWSKDEPWIGSHHCCPRPCCHPGPQTLSPPIPQTLLPTQTQDPIVALAPAFEAIIEAKTVQISLSSNLLHISLLKLYIKTATCKDYMLLFWPLPLILHPLPSRLQPAPSLLQPPPSPFRPPTSPLWSWTTSYFEVKKGGPVSKKQSFSTTNFTTQKLNKNKIRLSHGFLMIFFLVFFFFYCSIL